MALSASQEANPSSLGTVTFAGSSSGIVYLFENGVSIGTGATVTFGSGSYNVSTGTFSNTKWRRPRRWRRPV